MNKFKLILIAVLLLPLAGVAKSGKLLVGGSGWDKIAIIDQNSKAVEWSYDLPKGTECNCVEYTKAGNIAMSLSNGARLIDKSGNTIWDYKSQPGCETQSIRETPEGNFVLAIAGTPSRIVTLNSKGEEIKSVEYNTGISNSHGQHRQIKLSRNNTYLVPLVGKGELWELDGEGKNIRTIKVGGVPFSVSQLEGDNVLVSLGDKGEWIIFDLATEKVLERHAKNELPGISMGFVAEVVRYKDGRTLISNWLGHIDDKSQPILVMLNKKGEVIWRLDNGTPGIGAISTVTPIGEKIYR